jgi:hypothetical protein
MTEREVRLQGVTVIFGGCPPKVRLDRDRLLVTRQRSGKIGVRLVGARPTNFCERAGNTLFPLAFAGRFGREEFLEALASASRYGRIANLVIYGHASSTALYMLDDRGFYVSVAAVAKNSRLATGTDAERTSKLKNLGAREVIDLATLVHDGAIRFVDNAVIFLAGCETAGSTNMAPRGIAAQIAANSGATTIGSIGPTDQSMTERRGGFSANEYSRGTWVRFVKGGGSERLRTRILNALQQLHLEATSLPVAPAPPPAPPSVGAQFHPFRCAAQRPVGGEALLTSCGVDVYGEPIVQLHKGETRA